MHPSQNGVNNSHEDNPQPESATPNGDTPTKTHDTVLDTPPNSKDVAQDVKVGGIIPSASHDNGVKPISMAARTRWVVGAMKIQNEQQNEQHQNNLTLAQVVEAQVKLNRWAKMKRRIVSRYTRVFKVCIIGDFIVDIISISCPRTFTRFSVLY